MLPGHGSYPPYPPPHERSSAGVVIGLAVVGVFTYIAINLLAAVVLLMLAIESPPSDGTLVVIAVALGATAFGGGGLLLTFRMPWTKGLGLGLMLGWALTSLLTVGIFTGTNPMVYGGDFSWFNT